jgi:hypothetical protein
MSESKNDRFSAQEKHAICGTGMLARGTLGKVLRDEPVRPVVIYRLKCALQQLGLTDRMPELFARPHGGAPDPTPREIIEPEDAAADAQDPAAE